jgi:hypothetical protein
LPAIEPSVQGRGRIPLYGLPLSRKAVDVVLGRNYFPKEDSTMLRYWINRAFLLGTLVATSAVAAGWKWDRGF